jgi:hypothetical protein
MSQNKEILYYHYFQLSFKYVIRNVQKNQVVLKLKGTHQLLAYAEDMNLLGENTETTTKPTEL